MASRAVAGRPGRRILVIEDNVDAAESLAEVLRVYGHSVEVSLSGGEGIERARALRPDVVLCDLGLPRVDGCTVASTLRADVQLKATRLIAVTGHTAPEVIARALGAGFDDHIHKPTDIDQLIRLLHA